MRILLIKTSSLGDLIHTFPALTDAVHVYPDLACDWLVEECFSEIPTWHPCVKAVLPIALRRWRTHPIQAFINKEIGTSIRRLRHCHYDVIIDAQGLLKSALWANIARGMTHGFDRHSAREALAGMTYQHAHSIPCALHAIERIRRLFAAALQYSLPETPIHYGLKIPVDAPKYAAPYLVFLPATTWVSKQWPMQYWIELAQQAQYAGYHLYWFGYTPQERLFIATLIKKSGGALLPHLNLRQLACELTQANGVVGVDTGLAHLSAALNTPTVTLYGPTNTALTGVIGKRYCNLSGAFPCAPCRRRMCMAAPNKIWPPCFITITPEQVWMALKTVMNP